MNGMQKLVVLCLLALGLMVAGVAQSQGRALKLTQLKDNAAVTALKKGLFYVILPLTVCLGSCDNTKHAPQQDAPAKVETAIEEQPAIVETAIEEQPAMIDESSSWLVRDIDPQYGYGVYTHRPVWDEGVEYLLVKIHDETGKLLPEALRTGWNILYQTETGGWDGSGWYRRAIIEKISDEGVIVSRRFVSIDASQIVGVQIAKENQNSKNVIFSPSHILPYLHGAQTDLHIEINSTEDIYLLARVVEEYTSGHVEVRVRDDLYYIRQPGDEQVFTEHREHYSESGLGFSLLEQDNLIMKEDITIIAE